MITKSIELDSESEKENIGITHSQSIYDDIYKYNIEDDNIGNNYFNNILNSKQSDNSIASKILLLNNNKIKEWWISIDTDIYFNLIFRYGLESLTTKYLLKNKHIKNLIVNANNITNYLKLIYKSLNDYTNISSEDYLQITDKFNLFTLINYMIMPETVDILLNDDMFIKILCLYNYNNICNKRLHKLLHSKDNISVNYLDEYVNFYINIKYADNINTNKLNNFLYNFKKLDMHSNLINIKTFLEYYKKKYNITFIRLFKLLFCVDHNNYDVLINLIFTNSKLKLNSNINLQNNNYIITIHELLKKNPTAFELFKNYDTDSNNNHADKDCIVCHEKTNALYYFSTCKHVLPYHLICINNIKCPLCNKQDDSLYICKTTYNELN